MGLEFVTGAAGILAAAALVFAWMASLIASPGQGAGALVAAGVFLLIALAAATIDEKDSSDRPAAMLGVTPTPTPARAGDYFATNLAAFRGPATLTSGPLRKPLCLVRYYDRAVAQRNGGDPGANWWTTCKVNRGLRSIAAVRRVLALTHAWGARNGRVFARVPTGERVTYLQGVAARQCEPHGGHCYRGGGVQLLFEPDDFQRTWFSRRECASGREDAPAHFVACAG